MLNITQSQRIELLFAAMQDFFAAHPVTVFEAQQVIVPSHGVGVWLRYQMASQQGISARLNTDFFGTYEWSLYRRVLGNALPKNSPFARQVIQWRLFSYFLGLLEASKHPDQARDRPDAAAHQVLQPLLQTLHQQPSQQRLLWKMCEHIAQVFANYVLYRPAWLHQWGKGQHLDVANQLLQCDANTPDWMLTRYAEMEKWQQFLWQTLFSEEFKQRNAIQARFWHTLAQQPARQSVLPKSLTLFTLLQLPPTEFDFLKRLANYIDVQLLHYNPSQEYWADSVDPLWLQQFRLKNPHAAAFYDSRHPLLTRMGKQARDIFALLAELSGNDTGQWVDVFPDSFANSLLGQLQNDVLYLVQPGRHLYHLQPHDRSIQVHACHSSLRQLEVLHEQLIDWLGQDDTRQPSDIVIFVPNLLELAPLIRTVFSAQSAVYLPIQVTGVAQPDAVQLWQTLIGRYQLLDGRFTIEELLDWLALEPTQALYGLGRDEVQRLGDLLADAGFRRGFDAEHLRLTTHQQDIDSRFTLQFALNRLMLGVLMPVSAVHRDILPYAGLSRQDFELVARLARLYQDLASRRGIGTGPPQRLQYWLEVLRNELTVDFESALGTPAGQGIGEALDALQASLDLTRSSQLNLPLQFVLDEISQILEEAPPGSVPTGRITFSRLGTLRPLPYRLIVMLNLDSGIFPARDYQRTFDLMTVMRSQPGDRSRYIDEQGAFLDGLLLAQEACWLFYNGFDINDVHPRQPSGTLQELIEFLGSMIKPTPQLPDPLRQIVHYHSLEPFEVVNFDAMQPRSFAGTWAEVASNLQQQFATRLWFDQPLSPPPAAVYSLDRIIGQLCRPARHFLNQSRIVPVARQDVPATYEPLQVNRLDEYHIRALHQQQADQLHTGHLQAILPVGHAAQAYWKKSQIEAELNRRRLHRYAAHETPLTTRMLTLTGWQLGITTPAQADAALWLMQVPSKYKGQRHLRYWLEHLAWQVYRQTTLAQMQQGSGQRVVVLSDVTVIYHPVEAAQATAYLLDWLQVWQQASVEPWVLPPDLLLSEVGIQYDLDLHRGYIKDEKKLLANWLGESYSAHYAPHQLETCMLHRDWQLILRGQDAGQQFLHHVRQHAMVLYTPIRQFSQVLAQ